MGYTSLNTILSRGEKVSPRVLYILMYPLLEFLTKVRDSNNEIGNGRLTEDDILLSDDYDDFKVLNTSSNEKTIIEDWINIMLKVSDKAEYKESFKYFFNECAHKTVSLEDLHERIERLSKSDSSTYIKLIIIILVGLGIMAIINFKFYHIC